MGGEKIHDAARLYTEVLRHAVHSNDGASPTATHQPQISRPAPPSTQVLEDDPLCVGALIGRATFGTALSWYARSVCDYSLAIALGEHSASTFDGCGTMRLVLGHSGDACKDFQKADGTRLGQGLTH